MNNIKSVPLALQFPLFEGFEPRIVEEDLISFFKLFLLQPFVIPPFNSFLVYVFHSCVLSTCETWVPLGPHRLGSWPSPPSGSGLLEDPPTCQWAQPTKLAAHTTS
jgi:hypothetical protein